MMEVLYNTDFHAWTQEQATLLKSGRLSEVDINNLIEEIESMGKHERRGTEKQACDPDHAFIEMANTTGAAIEQLEGHH